MHPQHKTDRRKLTPVEQAYLVGRHDAGQSFGQISQETGTPKSIVVDTIHNTQKCDQLNSLPQACPCKTDAHTNHKLC
jgi:hypothetical protein